jgi:hypothetical protein
MASPTADNILQQVQTYQMSNLAYLQNLNCFIATANTRFKDFDKIEANLGSTVTFDLPPRFVTANSLVATFQPAAQRVQSLSVNNAYNTSYVFSAEQFIFNVKDYMEKFGKAATVELGAQIEANVALNCVTGPFRFYGDGVTAISSYQQLAQALAMFRNFGAVTTEAKGYISDVAVPSIINSGLQQFAMIRNNEIAHSWELGEFSRCDWYQSNLLPIHIAGTEGINATTLTVVSTTMNANNQVTAITFSGTHAATDANSVKQYDKFQFNDGVSGQTNLRYLTFTGHQVSANPVQFMATADAASTGGSQVTVSIYPPLQATVGANQNLNTAIVAGMQVSVLPSHRAGMITAGDPLFLAMPKLPEEVPFPTANKTDPDTGVSMRMYYGSKFGENQRGMIHDVIWGSTLVPEYAMGIIFPL